MGKPRKKIVYIENQEFKNPISKYKFWNDNPEQTKQKHRELKMRDNILKNS